MSQDDDPEARARGHATLGRRVSVWLFLVAIAVAPTLALPVLTGQLASERLREAASAARIEQDVLAIGDLDRLRSSISDEAAGSFVTMVASRTHLLARIFSQQLGLPTGSLTQMRGATDDALAAVPDRSDLRPTITSVRRGLARLRAQFDTATTAAGEGMTTLPQLGLDYSALGSQVSAAEHLSAQRIASGAEGVADPDLLASVHALEAVTTIVTSGGKRIGLFYSALLTSPSGQVGVSAALEAETNAYHVHASGLASQLTPTLGQTWQAIMTDHQFETLEEAMSAGRLAQLQNSGLVSEGWLNLSAASQLLPIVTAGTHVLNRLSSFLGQAVSESTTRARADAASASRRAWTAVAAVAVVLLVTAIALVVIGGLLRARLRNLAEGAQRLSAGFLEGITVQGPREVAATSEAINDAVASLRQVAIKAEILASGDLDSPELERPAPGPLGAAVHASVALIVAAVREREELRRELAHQATHDTLTGLVNRAELDRILRARLEQAQRTRTSVAVLFLDLDRFKACNDRLGHAAGDHVLREVGARLRAVVASEDVIGRYGGDEFVVVTDGDRTAGTSRLAREFVDELGRPFEYQGERLDIGVSVGVSTAAAGGIGGVGVTTSDQLVAQADAAAYRAKAAGGGRVVCYEPNSWSLATP